MRHLNVLPLVLGLATSTLACGGPGSSGSSTAADVQFAAPTLLSCVDGSAGWVRVGDFNGDHSPDLYVGCDQGTSMKRTVFLNNGDGTFGEPTSGPSGWDVLDINGDGRDDVLDYIGQTVSFANADGSFAKAVNVSIPAGCDDFTQDWNGDGWKDALCYYENKLEAMSFNANGSMSKLFSLTVPYRPTGADVNGDGKLDIVYANGASVIVQLSTANGFASPQAVVTTTGSASTPDFADVDGDGFVDMLVTSGASGARILSVIHNKAGTGFELWNQFPEVDGVDYILEDATGDGLADIVLTSQSSELAIMVGEGDGTFRSNDAVMTGPWTRTVTATFSDLNRDGRPDLVVPDGTVAVLLRQ